MYTENANRAAKEGFITPDNLEPNSKKPIIASFFRTIGRADRPGSGVRNLFQYSRFYSGQDPEFQEGDIFRIIVPLDEEYSFDYDLNIIADGKSMQPLTDTERKVLDLVKDNPAITQKQLAYSLSLSDSGIRYVMRQLKEKGLIRRIGSHRNGSWQLN